MEVIMSKLYIDRIGNVQVKATKCEFVATKCTCEKEVVEFATYDGYENRSKLLDIMVIGRRCNANVWIFGYDLTGKLRRANIQPKIKRYFNRGENE